MKSKVTFIDMNNPIPREDEQTTTVNLGALYIISALEREGYEIDYRDYQISRFSNSLKVNSIVEFSKESQDILMVCCMAYMLPIVVLAIKEFKEIYPEKIIILGGVGPTGVADKLIREFKEIDIVVKGEGEFVVVEVLKALEEKNLLSRIALLKGIKGIAFRDQNHNLISNSMMERCKELDRIAFPAYYKIDMNKYKEFGLITGRGCAYKCKFCDIHGLWGEKYYQRSIDNVMPELRSLVKEYGIEKIRIWDDTFTMSDDRVQEFCRRLKKEKLDIEWSCFGRVNLVNERLLETMANAGCKGIFYGLESGSEEILKKIDKRITLDSIIRAIEITVKYMDVKGHLIWGFPFESYEDLYKTLYLYNYLKNKINISMSQLWPYPTSPLYQEYQELIRFNPELDSFNKILHFKEDEMEDMKSVMQLITNHKDIFTQFCYYHVDSFMQRYYMVQDFYKLS